MNRWMIWGGVGVVAVAAVLTSVLFLPDADGPPEAKEDAETSVSYGDHLAEQARLAELGYDVHTDSDGDGLADVMENFLYGSDPQAFSTTGNGIPDGWFAIYGYDPTVAGVESRPASVPPTAALPDIYNGYWPDKYRWSLGDVYSYGLADDNGTFHDNGIDPNQWDAPSGLPMAWLVLHEPNGDVDGWNVTAPDLAERSLTDDGFTVTADGFTVRANYEHDTDPHLADTDGDGLSDQQEVDRYGTDPRRFSTIGGSIPDGWLVHHELDPLDPQVGSLDPAGKGMTVDEVWTFNLARFGLAASLDGEGLDPTEMSHRSDPVPDGWLVENGLDPLDPDITKIQSQCAADYEDVKHLDEAPDGLDTIPDLCLSVEQAYLFGRPTTWDEKTNGAWPGGLDPASGDQDGDGLPDAVEIRGWYLQRFVGVGPDAKAEWVHVASDPRKADTDGDGLTDHEEFHTTAERDGLTYRFSPSDPSNPDTAFSGMTDAEKVFGTFEGRSWDLHEEAEGALWPLLEPMRRDTAEDYLADGDAMSSWIQAGDLVRSERDGKITYRDVYPGSAHDSYLDWINRLDWVGADHLDHDEAAALLGPDGDADGDGVPNVVDAFASGDNLRNGWQVDLSTLRFSDFPAATTGQPRSPTDPANPDTDGDGLPDTWELRHGRWSDALGGWDLDPTKSKSDPNGDGESDAEGNLDGDEVTWYSYDSGERHEPPAWQYNNLLEFDFGTDPRDPDETQNGVTEGWVAFWGSERFYARWVRDWHGDAELPDDVELGTVIPSVSQIDAIQALIADPLNADVGTRVKDQLDYYRFVPAPAPTTQNALLDPGFDEGWLTGWPQAIQVLRDNEPTPVRLGWIEGTYQHTHADDQEWGLNPYLEDTSGDGIHDAWAAFYAKQCSLDPAHSRGPNQDAPGNSGLTVGVEYAQGNNGDHSTDPCQADTDLDGIHDGAELELGLNPVDPTDATTAMDDTTDSDGDGQPDSTELGSTSPTDPDSDRDGLLDGFNMPRSGDELPTEDIEAFKALGIAYNDSPCWADQLAPICFRGEETAGTEPVDATSRIQGVPDGWAVYYGQRHESQELRQKYACSMPAWWDEAELGVWWWGLTPQEGDCPRDRDHDGLDDHNGEDPVPGASQSNQAAGLDLLALMDDTTIDRLDVVRAAQGWGECAGNPHNPGSSCFDSWETAWENDLQDRFVLVKISNTEIVGLADDAVDKEQEFEVSGRLLVDDDACNSDCPVAHRTVALRLWNDQADVDPLQYDLRRDDSGEGGVTLGIGFTDGSGDFTITGCLCGAGGTIDVPEGMVALGRSNATASWKTPAGELAAGSQWILGVHAYASTPTFWGDPDRDDATHPQYMEVDGNPVATESRWRSFQDPVRITSDTLLEVEAPKMVPWSDEERLLRVTLALQDVSGGAVAGETVHVTAGDLEGFSETNAQGKAVLDFPLGSRTGSLDVQASYDGNATLAASVGEADVILQAPMVLSIPTPPTAARVGEATLFEVTATSQTQTVEGIEIKASLGSITQTRQTDADGVAAFTITPAGMDPGPAEIRFSASPTDEFAGASVTSPISLVSGSILHANVPEAGALDAPLSLNGHLTLSDGTPLDGKKIHATLAGETLAQFTTKSDGRFDGAPIVPLDLGIGVHKLRLTYGGETDAIDSATIEKPVRFSVGTLLSLDDLHAGRGQDTSLSGRLASITGTPLVGEEVNITLPWNETITVKARGGGNFSEAVAIPGDHALGVFQVNASYDGSANGTYGASQAKALLEIGSPSRIDAPPLGILHRGNNTVTGHLRDDETDAPIADATIHATPSTGEPRTLQTDDEGRFRFSLSLARDIPGGDIDVTFHYAGDEGYAPAQNTSQGILRVPARLSIAMPLELGRGTSHDIDVRLTDDRSASLAARNVTLSALGATWNATTDTDGNARFVLDVPLDTDLGATRISAAYAGDEAHDQAQATREATVKDGVHVNIDGMPDEVLPGQRVTLNIHVEDTSGRPVQTPILVRIDGVPGSLLVETDDLGRAQAPIVVPDTGAEALRVTVRFPGTDLLAARTESMQPTLGVATQAAAPATGWPWMATTAVAAILVATAAFVLLRRRRSNATDILQDTEKRITAGDPWATAVLDAYRRLVELVQAYGIEDDESQTGRAFAQTLVDAGFLHERAARELVALFERARYAGDAMDPADADEARRVLQGTIGAVQRTEARRGGTPA